MFPLKYYSVTGTYRLIFLSFMLLGLFLPASSFSFLYHLMLGAGFPATISHFRTVFFPSSTVTLRRSFNLGSAETKQNIKISPHSQYISSVEAFKEALLNRDGQYHSFRTDTDTKISDYLPIPISIQHSFFFNQCIISISQCVLTCSSLFCVLHTIY